MAELLSFHRLVRRARAEDGVGVPTALLVAVTVFLLGATWTQLGLHSASISTHDKGREQALNAAEAGLNQAMSRLTLDKDYAGESGTLPGGVGEFETTVAPVDPTNPDDMRRLITADGYSPSKVAERPVERRMEAQVDVEEADGFDYAAFAGNGKIIVKNVLDVGGDLYAQGGVEAGNNTTALGDLKTPAYIDLGNQTIVEGSIYADGNVTIGWNSTVQGSIYARGDVSLGNNTVVEGDVQAGGTITLGSGASIQGGTAEGSPPPPVIQESMPTFTWNPDNYSPAPTTWLTTSAFRDQWLNNTGGFNGHHKIDDTARLELDKKWKMNGDVTIVSDGEVVISHSISNATAGETLDLVVISNHVDGISIKNGATIPDSIRVLFFAPNGTVHVDNNKHVAGTFYGETVSSINDLDLTGTAPDAPGFSWTAATTIHYRVVVRVLREVVAPGS